MTLGDYITTPEDDDRPDRYCEYHRANLGRFGVCDKCEQERESGTVEVLHLITESNKYSLLKTTK